MERFNNDLSLAIRDFLKFSDHHKLMNTSKELFQSIRAATIFYPLNFQCTCSFFTNEAWKQKLISKVTNPDHQIQFLTSKDISKVTTFSDAFNWFLSLRDQSHPWGGEAVLLMRMSYSQYKQNKTKNKLENMNTLSLDGFHNIFDLDSLSQLSISDVSVNLGHSKIDVGFLSHLKKVSICCCQATEVNCLKEVEVLHLISCDRLIDVSGLTNVRFLLLQRCSSLEDISRLTNTYHIELLSCSRITNYASLRTAVEIRIVQQKELDLAVFRSVRSLEVLACKIKRKNNCLLHEDANLRSLTLSFPPQYLLKCNNFHSLTFLCINSCKSDFDLCHFPRVRSFMLRGCDKISSLSGLLESKLKRESICIVDCGNIVDFSPLAVFSRVTISLRRCSYRKGVPSQSSKFTSLRGLQDVEKLCICGLSDQTDISPLFHGKNQVLSIRGKISDSDRENIDHYYQQEQSNSSLPVYVRRNAFRVKNRNGVTTSSFLPL
jgi:hypothetical protein